MLVLDFLQGFENSKSQLTVRWRILTQILEKCKNLNADVERLRSSKACSVVTNAEHIQYLPFQTEIYISNSFTVVSNCFLIWKNLTPIQHQ